MLKTTLRDQDQDQDQTGRDQDRDQDQGGQDQDQDQDQDQQGQDQDQDQDLKKVVLIGLETKTRSRDPHPWYKVRIYSIFYTAKDAAYPRNVFVQ